MTPHYPQVTSEVDDDTVTVTVNGDIDAHTIRAFTDTVTAHVLSGTRTVHVNGTGVTFADVACGRGIARLDRLGQRAGIAVTVTASPALSRILDLLHIAHTPGP